MKRFYILANPEYFKKTMGWDMKHNDIKYTNDNLVMFVASENVPVTNIIEPYHCGYCDPDTKIYNPYFNIENKYGIIKDDINDIIIAEGED